MWSCRAGACCGRNDRSSRESAIKVNKMPQKHKGDWPFMVQVRKPGDPAGPAAWWAQPEPPTGNALDLDPAVFAGEDARAIAQSLKDAAERSERRRAPAFQSAMSMLTIYINRSGSQLPAHQRACLEAAKNELRDLYGRLRQGAAPAEARARKGARVCAAGAVPRFVERRSSLAS